jgi:methionyl-tRNA formyltransferase
MPILAGYGYNWAMSAFDRSRVPLRLLFLGLPAGISALTLRKLLDEAFDIVGVLVPASCVPHLLVGKNQSVSLLEPHLSLPVLTGNALEESNTLAIAWSAGLPVWAVAEFNHLESQPLIEALEIDVACVACFTHRIPLSTLLLPRFGFLNIHPSLLPAYRGPVPRFWQLRDGAATGVTVHYLDEGLDTGDVVAQTRVDLPEGVSGPEADRLLALSGFDLLRGILFDLSRDIIRRWSQPDGGTYFGYPRTKDFSLSTGWPARQAYNFMRGTADWEQTYSIAVAGTTFWLNHAGSYEDQRQLTEPYQLDGDHIAVNFFPGVLRGRIVNRTGQIRRSP